MTQKEAQEGNSEDRSRSPAGRRGAVAALFMAMAFLCFVVLVLVENSQGVTVSIHNASEKEIRQIKVYVTGVCYDFGVLSHFESRRLRVEPLGESGIEIEFTDETNSRRRFKVDCYLDGFNVGDVTITIAENRVLDVVDETRTRYF